jgi:hypothetical protein
VSRSALARNRPPTKPIPKPTKPKDEPFHAPATRRYCCGDLATWDPKITTFPGLYALGAAYAWAARAALGWAGMTLVRRFLLSVFFVVKDERSCGNSLCLANVSVRTPQPT